MTLNIYNNSEVVILKYDNLQSLIQNSNSTRKFFLSLPVNVQLELHKHNDYIHSANQLHNLVYSMENNLYNINDIK